MELSNGPEVLPVAFWGGQSGVELQTPDHVEDVLGEHQLEKGVFVEEEDVFENVVEVV